MQEFWPKTGEGSGEGGGGIQPATASRTDSLSSAYGPVETTLFPDDQPALAFGVSGDAYPRVVFLSDPTDAILYAGDGTSDATSSNTWFGLDYGSDPLRFFINPGLAIQGNLAVTGTITGLFPQLGYKGTATLAGKAGTADTDGHTMHFSAATGVGDTTWLTYSEDDDNFTLATGTYVVSLTANFSSVTDSGTVFAQLATTGCNRSGQLSSQWVSSADNAPIPFVGETTIVASGGGSTGTVFLATTGPNVAFSAGAVSIDITKIG